MKFPKLRNRHICKTILYLPAFLWIFFIFVIAFFEDYIHGDWMHGAALAVCFVCGGLGLVYLFKNFVFLMWSDAVFEGIRVWQKARMHYKTERNGSDRKTAERKLLRRIKLCGKEYQIDNSDIAPIAVRRRCNQSMTIFWRAIEKISMVYSVGELDEKNYRTIVNSALLNVRKIHKEPGKYLIEDKSQKNAPVATATAIIILADKISDKIPELVLQNKISAPFGETLVCVGDMNTCKYYFDAVREPHMLGMEGKPEKNYSFDLTKWIVFGGCLPLKGNEAYVLQNEEQKRTKEMADMSLWEYIKDVIGELKEARKEEKTLIKSFKYLNNGEIKLVNDEIYCKHDDKITSRPLEIDENNPKKLTIYRFNQWIYPNKRTMSKKDMGEVEKLMDAYLTSEGYTAEFKDFEEIYEDDKGE